jgi:ABC-type transporter Mla MlaB component
MIAGEISADQTAALCEQLLRLCDECPRGQIICDVAALTRADLAAVDGLARLQLAARRRGRSMRLRGSCHELRRLVRLLGLRDVLATEHSERQRGLRQSEQGKQGGGLEKRGEPDHPPV